MEEGRSYFLVSFLSSLPAFSSRELKGSNVAIPVTGTESIIDLDLVFPFHFPPCFFSRGEYAVHIQFRKASVEDFGWDVQCIRTPYERQMQCGCPFTKSAYGFHLFVQSIHT